MNPVFISHVIISGSSIVIRGKTAENIETTIKVVSISDLNTEIAKEVFNKEFRVIPVYGDDGTPLGWATKRGSSLRIYNYDAGKVYHCSLQYTVVQPLEL